MLLPINETVIALLIIRFDLVINLELDKVGSSK